MKVIGVFILYYGTILIAFKLNMTVHFIMYDDDEGRRISV